MTNDTTTRFEIGQTYSTRSACDYDCVFSYTVTKRSARFITITDAHGQTSRRGVEIYDGAEHCSPEGHYSMAPRIHADEHQKKAAPAPAATVPGPIAQPADLVAQMNATAAELLQKHDPATILGWSAGRLSREVDALAARKAFTIVAA